MSDLMSRSKFCNISLVVGWGGQNHQHFSCYSWLHFQYTLSICMAGKLKWYVYTDRAT